MEPTPELRTRLRSLIAERIPEGGDEIDTNFTTTDIDGLLKAADVIEEAAYRGWILKATWVLEGKELLISANVGGESFNFATPFELHKAFMDMADYYKAQIPLPAQDANPGSRIFSMAPDPAFDRVPAGTRDLSRLIGY